MSDEDGVKWDEFVRQKEQKDKQGVEKGRKISLGGKGVRKSRQRNKREGTKDRKGEE